ncbi:hypothetical protein BLA13014_02581 [Burkholderia aenigmatica]|uniref:Uncharacterized protein n=1 Tax=Burkholderia aenigmatica TaxID=2015348 RepID=A0A6P2KU74_9BURK|nr:hypothetical protein BLA13014_02581 [Burkholderia aenigmatica]
MDAANSRPNLNAFASPIVTTAAVAVSRPTPGIAPMACALKSVLIHCLSRCSMRVICSSRCVKAAHCSWRVSISGAATWSPTRSRTAAIFASKARRPAGMTSPYSPKSLRMQLIWEVQNFTSCWRSRCKASTACCASLFTATLLRGCCTASQIARASAATFLLPMLNALATRGAIRRTWCPSLLSDRAQCCEPPHASTPIMHDSRLAKYSRKFARLSDLLMISPLFGAM